MMEDDYSVETAAKDAGENAQHLAAPLIGAAGCTFAAAAAASVAPIAGESYVSGGSGGGGGAASSAGDAAGDASSPSTGARSPSSALSEAAPAVVSCPHCAPLPYCPLHTASSADRHSPPTPLLPTPTPLPKSRPPWRTTATPMPGRRRPARRLRRRARTREEIFPRAAAPRSDGESMAAAGPVLRTAGHEGGVQALLLEPAGARAGRNGAFRRAAPPVPPALAHTPVSRRSRRTRASTWRRRSARRARCASARLRATSSCSLPRPRC